MTRATNTTRAIYDNMQNLLENNIDLFAKPDQIENKLFNANKKFFDLPDAQKDSTKERIIDQILTSEQLPRTKVFQRVSQAI